MPLVLGDGLRPLEHSEGARIELEKIDVKEVGARTSLSFPVSKTV